MNSIRFEGTIPQWTIGDRLRKARGLTGLTTREFAREIGVSQVTVTSAENDRHGVRKIVLNAWALATGVDRGWLETGIPDAPTAWAENRYEATVERRTAGAVRHQGLEPRTRCLSLPLLEVAA